MEPYLGRSILTMTFIVGYGPLIHLLWLYGIERNGLFKVLGAH
jgi:hypothetical protein